MRFVKMHGCGNDYVYVDLTAETAPEDEEARADLARAVSDRRRGIGSDGLILIAPPEGDGDLRMIMYNADGSRGEMCGNGIRCVGKYAWEAGLVDRENPVIETDAGPRALTLHLSGEGVSRVAVDMGEPVLDPAAVPVDPAALGGDAGETLVDAPLTAGDRELRVTCVGMGNPHCVTFVDDARAYPVEKVGPAVEGHAAFPARTNAEFVQVVAEDEVIQRTWERGSGETHACGTGAAAVCVAGVLTGRTGRRVTVHLVGGDLDLEWREDGPVIMTGPAVEVFRGEWPL